MRIHVIRQPLGLTAILVVLLLALLRTRSGIWAVAAEQIPLPTGPIGTWIDIRLETLDALRITLSCLLLFFSAFHIAQIVTRNMVLVVRTYLPALFFVVVGCGIYLPDKSLSAILAAFLMIRASGHMIAGFQRKPTYDRFFRAGITLGFIPLLYAPAIIALPMLIGGLAFFRRGWRETLIAIVAFALPTALYSYLAWMSGLPADLPFWQVAGAIANPSGFCLWTDADPLRLILIGLIAVLTILSVANFARFAKHSRTRARRVFSYFIWVLLLCAGCFFLPCASPADWIVIAVPMAVVTPYYFVRHAGIVAAAIYLLLLAGVTALNIAAFIG